MGAKEVVTAEVDTLQKRTGLCLVVLQVCVLCFALESTHRIVGSQLSAVGAGLEASQASSTPGSWMLCAFSGLRDGVR